MLCVDLEMVCGGIVLSLTGSALLCCAVGVLVCDNYREWNVFE